MLLSMDLGRRRHGEQAVENARRRLPPSLGGFHQPVFSQDGHQLSLVHGSEVVEPLGRDPEGQAGQGGMDIVGICHEQGPL